MESGRSRSDQRRNRAGRRRRAGGICFGCGLARALRHKSRAIHTGAGGRRGRLRGAGPRPKSSRHRNRQRSGSLSRSLLPLVLGFRRLPRTVAELPFRDSCADPGGSAQRARDRRQHQLVQLLRPSRRQEHRAAVGPLLPRQRSGCFLEHPRVDQLSRHQFAELLIRSRGGGSGGRGSLSHGRNELLLQRRRPERQRLVCLGALGPRSPVHHRSGWQCRGKSPRRRKRQWIHSHRR